MKPFEVIEGKHTQLPIPAYSEVAIEGEVIPGTKIPEGPFGEFTGYYAGGLRTEPMLKVKRLMYRNDPIITGAPPFRPAPGAESNLIRAAYIWHYLDKAGVPDVRGVAYHQTRMLVVVAIKQRYPGHARQAALIASQCRAAALLTRYVVVVDEDIDIWDSNELLWALCTRTDPAKDIDILRRCWSNPIDPIIPPSERGFQSRGIIDACKPYEWINEFPKVSGASAELKEKVAKKFGASLAGKRAGRGGPACPPVLASLVRPMHKDLPKKIFLRVFAALLSLFCVAQIADAQQKPLEKVRLTVPAKSLTFVPYYFGRAHGIFAKEGIDLEIIVMRPPLGVTALLAGELDYSAAGGLSRAGGDERRAVAHDHVHPDAVEF